jgi:REP element-mobilizing transposase RayT
MNYLITFRTYGTWLHGDERGTVDARHNVVGTPLLENLPAWKIQAQKQMKGERVIFDSAQRECVAATIREVTEVRGWTLRALAVQTNHIHAVVDADYTPEKVMNDWKSYATRRLREQGLVPQDVPIWSQHGSTKYLNTSAALIAACQYVAENQADLSDCP